MKDDEMGGLVAHMGELNSYSILVGKPERKGLVRRPRHRWEDKIRMDLRETV
jgi:hypothetical protein